MEKATRFEFGRFAARYGAVSLLVLLLAVNMVFTRNFLSVNVLWNLVVQGTVTMIVALGMTLAISSGGIDLSVGSVMPIAAMVTAKSLGFGVVPAVLLGLLVAVAAGCFNGLMIGAFGMQPFIATLAMYMAGRGIAQLLNNSMVFNFVHDGFTALSRTRIGGQVPVQMLIVPLIILAMAVLVRRSAMGRCIQAIGDNREAARLSGVRALQTTIFVYAASAGLAGLAGILEIARIGAADPNTLGKMVELDAIAAVVLGGTPMVGGRINLTGSVFAALVMQLIVITVNMNNIPAEYAYVVKSVVLIGAVIIQQRESLKR